MYKLNVSGKINSVSERNCLLKKINLNLFCAKRKRGKKKGEKNE